MIFGFNCPGKTSSATGEIEKPSVEIRLTSGGNIAAVVKNDTAFLKTVFLLQSTDQVVLNEPIILTNTSVNYSGNCVVFQSKDDGRNVVFRLAGAGNCGTPSNNLGVYEGFGLASQNGDDIYNAFINSGGTFPDIQAFSCTCKVKGTSAQSCDSGGVGSNGCSTTSTVGPISTGCSVNCNDGYFACCVD